MIWLCNVFIMILFRLILCMMSLFNCSFSLFIVFCNKVFMLFFFVLVFSLKEVWLFNRFRLESCFVIEVILILFIFKFVFSIGVVFFVFILILLVIFLFRVFIDIGDILSMSDFVFIFISIFCMGMFWICSWVMLSCLFRFKDWISFIGISFVLFVVGVLFFVGVGIVVVLFFCVGGR